MYRCGMLEIIITNITELGDKRKTAEVRMSCSNADDFAKLLPVVIDSVKNESNMPTEGVTE